MVSCSLGLTLLSISDQMYLSRSRFIVELLQNADDAMYAPAVRPYLTFRLRRNLLIVDSNELGFTIANVKSICSTGESSKKGDSQTTGEKGLGFKSVFGIANEVHIQSGKWSFHFKHRRGEDGLGMVTPLWTPPSSEPLPPGVVTRFRLSLTNSDPGALGKLMKEFDNLPDTLVFATRKVTRVEIIYEDVLARTQNRTIEREGELLNGQIEICNHIQSDDTDVKTTTMIRTITHEATDMPVEELRDSSRSSVTLGFQINPETGYPVIPDRGQHVFAFLPVQRLVQLPVSIQNVLPKATLTIYRFWYRQISFLAAIVKVSRRASGTKRCGKELSSALHQQSILLHYLMIRYSINGYHSCLPHQPKNFGTTFTKKFKRSS